MTSFELRQEHLFTWPNELNRITFKIIEAADIDNWMGERNPKWTNGSTADFGFEYGTLTGEVWLEEGTVVFHTNQFPEVGFFDGTVEVPQRSRFFEDKDARVVVQGATAALLGDYHAAWVRAQISTKKEALYGAN